MGLEKFNDKLIFPTQEEIERERVYVLDKISEIGEERLSSGIQSAVEVRKNSYPPYSGYMVGATVLCKSGLSYSSCNAETVSYSGTDHAEKSAISKAISEGEIHESGSEFIDAMIVSHPGESGPCCECRQRMLQHCQNALVVDVDGEGNVQAITSLRALTFYSFVPSHLDV